MSQRYSIDHHLASTISGTGAGVDAVRASCGRLRANQEVQRQKAPSKMRESLSLTTLDLYASARMAGCSSAQLDIQQTQDHDTARVRPVNVEA